MSIFFSTSIYAFYYADINIDVDSDGSVSIVGDTNYSKFIDIVNAQYFTSKKAEYWTLNITSDEIFENYNFELNLPKYAKINYIKTTQYLKIEEENNRIKLIGHDKDKRFNLAVQYTLHPNQLYENDTMMINNFFVYTIGLVFVLILLLYVFFKFGSQKYRGSIERRDDEQIEKKIVDLNKLTQRQQDIVLLLQKYKKLTQKQLQNKLQIPHSSVSRNVNSLQIKGIIIKDKVGQSNYISLK